jgi:hypothetical protein
MLISPPSFSFKIFFFFFLFLLLFPFSLHASLFLCMSLLQKGLQRTVYNSALLNQISFHKIVNISARKIFVTSLGHSFYCKAPSHKFLTNAQCETPNANLHTTKHRLESSNKKIGLKKKKRYLPHRNLN